MVKYPVKHGSRQNRVTHHLRPLGDLLVCGKDDRGGLVGVADKGEEAVCFVPGDRRISDLVNNDQLCLPDVLQPEPGGALDIGVVQDPGEAGHALKADRVTAVDCFKPQSCSDHGLAESGRPGKYDVRLGIYPVELFELPELAFSDPGIQL